MTVWELRTAERAVVPSASAELFVIEGPAKGHRHVFEDELLIGREAPGIGALGGDEQLSRRHALVRRTQDGRPSILDLNSRNGTFVNELRIAATCYLEPEDRVRVGRSVFGVKLGPSAHGDPPQPANPSSSVRVSPGGRAPELDSEMPGYRHEAELAALLSPRVAAALAAAGIRRIGFSDL